VLLPQGEDRGSSKNSSSSSTCQHMPAHMHPRQHTCSHSTQTALYCSQQMICHGLGLCENVLGLCENGGMWWLLLDLQTYARPALICYEACFLVARSVAMRCSGSLCHDEGHAVGLSCVQGHCCQWLSCNNTLPAHLMC
jgi:hypothetical protein